MGNTLRKDFVDCCLRETTFEDYETDWMEWHPELYPFKYEYQTELDEKFLEMMEPMWYDEELNRIREEPIKEIFLTNPWFNVEGHGMIPDWDWEHHHPKHWVPGPYQQMRLLEDPFYELAVEDRIEYFRVLQAPSQCPTPLPMVEGEWWSSDWSVKAQKEQVDPEKYKEKMLKGQTLVEISTPKINKTKPTSSKKAKKNLKSKPTQSTIALRNKNRSKKKQKVLKRVGFFEIIPDFPATQKDQNQNKMLTINGTWPCIESFLQEAQENIPSKKESSNLLDRVEQRATLKTHEYMSVPVNLPDKNQCRLQGCYDQSTNAKTSLMSANQLVECKRKSFSAWQKASDITNKRILTDTRKESKAVTKFQVNANASSCQYNRSLVYAKASIMQTENEKSKLKIIASEIETIKETSLPNIDSAMLNNLWFQSFEAESKNKNLYSQSAFWDSVKNFKSSSDHYCTASESDTKNWASKEITQLFESTKDTKSRDNRLSGTDPINFVREISMKPKSKKTSYQRVQQQTAKESKLSQSREISNKIKLNDKNLDQGKVSKKLE